ncbi:hypothetical protein FOA43_002210 [Brettanomyces nanus]|uniref:Uncharacterized protein n=1 Tax=Eeniella nana TaxID=13502 RepID=A0A875S6R7_EENNA|nr:uncharacterized protein FOA43_002210 [Brettanomyces nanus]QPG74874.1 hypothetical protein FOA43_002210 [Brettanomyces nanus]
MNVNIQLQGSKEKIRRLSLYKSCEGEYTVNRRYGYSLLSRDKEIVEDAIIDHTEVPKLKRQYELKGEYLQPVLRIAQQGHKVSPDELLCIGWKYNPAELPYMSREQIKKRTGQGLPDSELLKSLHYYMLDRVRKSSLTKGNGVNEPDFKRFLDESSMIALGKVIESWIEKMVDEGDTWKDYMEVTLDDVQKEESTDESASNQSSSSSSPSSPSSPSSASSALS